jgi:lysozyme
MIEGIDIYHRDDLRSFHDVKASGVEFVYLKATEGLTITDVTFTNRWERAKEVGLLRGAYHFLHPDEDPTKQAQRFLKAAPVSKGDLIYWLDSETEGPHVGPNSLAFAHVIKEETGRFPVLYTYSSFYESYLKPYFPANTFTLSLARYDGLRPVSPSIFWQYSETGTVPGVNGHCDLDHFYGTLDDLKKLTY